MDRTSLLDLNVRLPYSLLLAWPWDDQTLDDPFVMYHVLLHFTISKSIVDRKVINCIHIITNMRERYVSQTYLNNQTHNLRIWEVVSPWQV